MKRDPQYPVTIVGETLECGPEVQNLFRNARGKRVAVSSDGICHGLKRMPVERTRKDGVVVGQVYLYGQQWRGEVRSCQWGDFIYSDVGSRSVVVLPCPWDREAWNASGRPVGAPLEVFAFQAGITDLGLARRVQEALVSRAAIPAGVTVPSVSEPWTVPPGFRAFVAPYPSWGRGAYFLAGMDGSLEDWRGVLGWSGPGSLMAAMELRDAVLRGRGVVTPGLVEFPEWDI